MSGIEEPTGRLQTRAAREKKMGPLAASLAAVAAQRR